MDLMELENNNAGGGNGLLIAAKTFGCRVNQCETLSLLTQLRERGYGVTTAEPERAPDCVIVNTCAVTAEAERKCRQYARHVSARYDGCPVILLGCLPQLQGEEAAPLADNVIYTAGSGGFALAADFLDEYFGVSANGASEAALSELGGRHRAYVKLQDGCDSACSYCIIPKLRGPSRSREPEAVIAEIGSLAARGVREAVLTGIETAAYGRDLPGSCGLIDLLEKIDALELKVDMRIRLGSLDPAALNDGFIDRLAALRKFAPHIHLSLQSGCDATLRSMRRKYNTAMVARSVARLREAIPYIEFTADVIVGHPGETEQDFAQSLDFVRSLRLIHAHVFCYSKRPGTEAASMEGQVPAAEKKRRLKLMERAVGECRSEIFNGYKGKSLHMLLEDATPRSGGATAVTGYSENYIPCLLELSGASPGLAAGAIVAARAVGEQDGALMVEPMKFYIASLLNNYEQVQCLAKMLKAVGWIHTYDWTVQGPVKSTDSETLGAIGEKEFDGVKNADIVIVLTPQGRGTHTEFGMAIALNKKIYLCHIDDKYFKCDENTSSFYWLPQVRRIVGSTEEIAMEVLRDNGINGEKPGFDNVSLAMSEGVD